MGELAYMCGVPKTDRVRGFDRRTTAFSCLSNLLDKKLSCRRQAVRCFVSLKILLCHSMSFKVIQNYTVIACY